MRACCVAGGSAAGTAVAASQSSTDRPSAGLFAGLQFKRREHAGSACTSLTQSSAAPAPAASSSHRSHLETPAAAQISPSTPAVLASDVCFIEKDAAEYGCGDPPVTGTVTSEEKFSATSSGSPTSAAYANPAADVASAENYDKPPDTAASAAAPDVVVLRDTDKVVVPPAAAAAATHCNTDNSSLGQTVTAAIDACDGIR